MDSSKLRAACDRCHQLKNRCARSGGPESRCDRCERLDIDCIFRANARMGRPRGQRSHQRTSPASNSDGNQSTRNQTVFSRTQNRSMRETRRITTAKGEHLHHGDPESHSTPNHDTYGVTLAPTPPGIWDEDIIPDGCHMMDMETLGSEDTSPITASGPGLEWDFDLPVFHQPLQVNTGPKEDTLSSILASLPQQILLSDHYEGNLSPKQDLSSTTGSTNEPRYALDIKRLVELQNRLHGLMCSEHLCKDQGDFTPDTETNSHLPVDEVLGVTSSLLEILQATRGTDVNPSCESIQTAPKQESSKYLGVLHAVTCYAYLVEIVESIIPSLAMQIERSTNNTSPHAIYNLDPRLTGNITPVSEPTPDKPMNQRPILKLGCFSLESQPSLNAHVVLHIILRMIQELHVSFRLLISGPRATQRNACTEGELDFETDWKTKLEDTATGLAAQSIIREFQEKDTALLEKLRCLTAGGFF
ncbi:hypothetical protein BDV25DRAFT_6008 [Aspergillus avenaceus]|uniref:Zn(2)-C6 fungal-type domain-containing protein n=1 Tax=Aspergillus avenaceus TaxID=36643 RepID=A0A5N6U5V0_ASPAV|nr:hypothetical protein BDV25DRAFT_6008 [Aspergillus avenaceus]